MFVIEFNIAHFVTVNGRSSCFREISVARITWFLSEIRASLCESAFWPVIGWLLPLGSKALKDPVLYKNLLEQTDAWRIMATLVVAPSLLYLSWSSPNGENVADDDGGRTEKGERGEGREGTEEMESLCSSDIRRNVSLVRRRRGHDDGKMRRLIKHWKGRNCCNCHRLTVDEARGKYNKWFKHDRNWKHLENIF